MWKGISLLSSRANISIALYPKHIRSLRTGVTSTRVCQLSKVVETVWVTAQGNLNKLWVKLSWCTIRKKFYGDVSQNLPNNRHDGSSCQHGLCDTEQLL